MAVRDYDDEETPDDERRCRAGGGAAGIAGLRVLAVAETDPEVVIDIETTAELADCRSRAEAQDRVPVAIRRPGSAAGVEHRTGGGAVGLRPKTWTETGGDREQARGHLEEGLALLQDAGDRPGIAASLARLARAAARCSRPVHAGRLFGAAAAPHEALRTGPFEPIGLFALE